MPAAQVDQPKLSYHKEAISDAHAGNLSIASPGLRGTLRELSIGQLPNKSCILTDLDLFDTDSAGHRLTKSAHLTRTPRLRAPVGPDTFEPLDAVQEESIVASNPAFSSVSVETTNTAVAFPSRHPHLPSSTTRSIQAHPLLMGNESELYKRQEIEKHLAATPLANDAYFLSDMNAQAHRDQFNMSLTTSYEPSPRDSDEATPRKLPGAVDAVEQATSPSMTLVSERSSGCAEGSSRAGSICVPRIEDSLEELDNLEDQLEAINAATNPQEVPTEEKSDNVQAQKLEAKSPSFSKRASMSSVPATVRVKQSEKPAVTIRRSTSLVARNKKEQAEPSPNLKTNVLRTKAINSPASVRNTIKSSKPPTVPKFELPGEAVSRRLKEQREARQAAQAQAQTETQKAYTGPQRRKSSKPLTKPAFELPGEAISRRKREEREARLKALEEEERQKREFKARPVRFSVPAGTLPRDTVASRARQAKVSPEIKVENQAEAMRAKRVSTGPHTLPKDSSGHKVSPVRGRLTSATSQEEPSRATSTSTSSGSNSGKRNTLSSEETQQLKVRGREIFQRDNTSYLQDKERERREREAAARRAREEAAERSRAASREWAEKKRRKALGLRDSLLAKTGLVS